MDLSGKRVKMLTSVISQALDDESVLLKVDTGEYFSLNSVGTRVWQLLARGDDPEKIVDAVVEEFSVERDRFESDLAELLNQLRQHDLIELI